jgi:serine phosphatase RsbU (regulator of sigma subunit)
MTYSAAPCGSQLRVVTRYLPAAQGASGDIHDLVQTPFGMRLLIGDVMGTREPDSETGAEVIAAWREIACSEPSLPGVAVRLHGLVTRSEHPDRFVTALLINFADSDWAEFVCCGHPPPLLLRGASATFIEPCPASPPLGLLDLADGWCAATQVPFVVGDRLLFYTDGVSEARDAAGRFFPLPKLVAAASGRQCGAPELLDSLVADLRAYRGKPGAERTIDDILMLLVERI